MVALLLGSKKGWRKREDCLGRGQKGKDEGLALKEEKGGRIGLGGKDKEGIGMRGRREK